MPELIPPAIWVVSSLLTLFVLLPKLQTQITLSEVFLSVLMGPIAFMFACCELLDKGQFKLKDPVLWRKEK